MVLCLVSSMLHDAPSGLHHAPSCSIVLHHAPSCSATSQSSTIMSPSCSFHHAPSGLNHAASSLHHAPSCSIRSPSCLHHAIGSDGPQIEKQQLQNFGMFTQQNVYVHAGGFASKRARACGKWPKYWRKPRMASFTSQIKASWASPTVANKFQKDHGSGVCSPATVKMQLLAPYNTTRH